MSCTATGSGATGVINLGKVSPSEALQASMTGNCRVTRAFPSGASLSQTQFYNTAIRGPAFTVFHVDSGNIVPYQLTGTATTVCVPSSCIPLPVGTTFSYNILLTAPAASNPGTYRIGVTLHYTSINGWENYAGDIQNVIVQYTVIQPACTMGSANTLNLSFGTLNSNDFATAQQIANVTMNCTRGTQATATLVPTQSTVSGSPGVSATTLAGLSMVATWADNNTAVTFNSPRTLSLTPGTNNIRLGFRPRLNTNISPTGNFSSQYTLNITYL